MTDDIPGTSPTRAPDMSGAPRKPRKPVAAKPAAPARKAVPRKPAPAARSAPATTASTVPVVSAAKPAPLGAASSAPEPAAPVATAPEAAPRPETLELKKRELLNLVVRRSGLRKKEAKPVVEAMLEVLGEEVAEGRELNLMPFGKFKINRTKKIANGRVVIGRLRQKDRPQIPPRDPLADATE